MRILIVAFTNSVHTARYLQHFDETDWELAVFDSQYGHHPHPDTPPVTIYSACDLELPATARYTLIPPESGSTPGFSERARELSALIDEFEPDMIHSHETQYSGALVDAARIWRGGLPCPWILTSWGSDMSMYGRHENYVDRIKSICSAVDYFGGECHRDIALARAFGFTGKGVGVWPVAGGLDAARTRELSQPGPVSARRSITVKGVKTSIARGEVAVEALKLVGEKLRGYEVCTYQTNPELLGEFEKVAESNGATYNCVSGANASQVSHDEILATHGRSRLSLALNHSDGMSSSFMEAMGAGSFPIHSRGSCGREVTPAGRGAIFVSPTDAAEVAAAVSRALTDDQLVDNAAEINLAAAAEHLDQARVRARVLGMYERIFDQTALEAI